MNYHVCILHVFAFAPYFCTLESRYAHGNSKTLSSLVPSNLLPCRWDPPQARHPSRPANRSRGVAPSGVGREAEAQKVDRLVESSLPRSLRADTTRGTRFVYVSSAVAMHLQERWLNSSIIGSKCRVGQGKDASSGADRSLFLVFVSRAPCKLQKELQSNLV